MSGAHRVAVLISGRGTNLQALLDAARAGELGGGVAIVVSNVEAAPGLDRARQAGVPTCFVPPAGTTREVYDELLAATLERYAVDLVCLAGYMRLLSPRFVQRFPRRILNVHPSLLPAFPGLHAQRQAWEHGVKVAGATVHFVDEGLDTGPIVAQEAVAVLDSDTAETLAERILAAEHRIYPRAVRRVLDAGVRIDGRRVLPVSA